MDWSRAKTILIIAFILLNLFLVTELHEMRLQQSNIQTDHIDKTQVNYLLKENQLTLRSHPPVEWKPLPLYQATVSEWKGNGWGKDEGAGMRKTLSEPFTFKKVEEIHHFLKRNVPYFDEYKWIGFVQHPLYIQKSKSGYPIYDGRLEVNNKNGFCNVRMVHYELKEASWTSNQLIDYYTAIYRLITSGKLTPKSVISSVQLVYRAKSLPNSSGDLILVPYWHFHVGSKIWELNATDRGWSESVELVFSPL